MLVPLPFTRTAATAAADALAVGVGVGLATAAEALAVGVGVGDDGAVLTVGVGDVTGVVDGADVGIAGGFVLLEPHALSTLIAEANVPRTSHGL